MDKHLHPDEKVLWSGKPVRARFILPALLIGLVLGLSWSVGGTALTCVEYTGQPPYPPLMSLEAVVLLIWVIPGFGIVIAITLEQFLRYRNTEYIITDQRIITQTGAIGLDTRFVDLDKVQEVYVKVGVIDKLFGTGSVIAVTAGYVHIGRSRPSLAALKEPYKVQKLLQKTVDNARQKISKKD